MGYYLLVLWCSIPLAATGVDPWDGPVCLGSCVTPLGDSPFERAANIGLAASKVDGLTLPPGATFSFNETVGRRTAEVGFRYAPALIYGEKSMQLGGGICQLSSTLYNAALLAGLRVKTRYRHTNPVFYMEPGLDATVSWGSKDLVFLNSLDHPIQIHCGIEDENVFARILGETPSPREVHLETECFEVPPNSDEPNMQPGFEVILFRVYSVNGIVEEREYLHRDLYPCTIIKEREDLELE
jgi:vancomycin resistance protein YoaR